MARLIVKLGLIFGSAVLLTACQNVPNDIGTLLQNLDRSYIPVLRLVVASSYVMGLFFLLAGFYKLKRYGEARTMMMTQIEATGPLMMILVGTGLLYFPELVRLSMETVWGSDNVLKYTETSATFESYFLPIVHIVRLVGYISFIRGWMMLSRMGKQGAQPGIFGKSLMYIVGGILAINLVGVMKVLSDTLA